MQTTITVREFARLTTSPIQSTLDEATVSQDDFDWLCSLGKAFRNFGATLLQVNDRRWLQLDSYVGVLKTPGGTSIEILPKHYDDGANISECRALLCRMIQAALDLPSREVGAADIELFDAPLSEWVAGQFLRELDHLVKRGLRFDYQRIDEKQRFLRGQLDFGLQLRQPPGRHHLFHIRHDLYLPDRAENRLLKTALSLVANHTQNVANWRRAHELLSLMAEIPQSLRIEEDFKRWTSDRLMAHYTLARPWCELILRQQMPMAVHGDWYGISLLFPMEILFECFVETSLRRHLPINVRLTRQAASRYLCKHKGDGFFQLRPDMLLQQGSDIWVLDTKWKRLNGADAENKYGLSQGDFYQLFAYGERYLSGNGQLVLIYPRTITFQEPLTAFYFSDSMRLWVLPFDLDKQCVIEPNEVLLPKMTRG